MLLYYVPHLDAALGSSVEPRSIGLGFLRSKLQWEAGHRSFVRMEMDRHR